MYFQTKNILKNNYYNTHKHPLIKVALNLCTLNSVHALKARLFLI
jgi:hypothetical protein